VRIAVFHIILVVLITTGCGDNFDRDELINGPQATIDETIEPADIQTPSDTAEQPDTLQPDEPVTVLPSSVTVTVTTSTYGGQYAPRNVFAIWLEAVDGSYIHSLGVWAKTYKSKLTRWYPKSSYGASGMADAVTGASRTAHGSKTVSLDLTKYPVAAGDYKVWFELNETNGGSKSTSADITLGPGGTVTGVANTANITDIAISFTP
jgi:hypothetical protein